MRQGKHWEYKVVGAYEFTIDYKYLEDGLNALASQGWRYVGSVTDTAESNRHYRDNETHPYFVEDFHYNLIFEREVSTADNRITYRTSSVGIEEDDLPL